MIETTELVGAKLGTYEIQALLGSGGMASVYRGFDVNLQREVAIKVLSETAAAQPGLAARFRQEAQIIAGLHHPSCSSKSTTLASMMGGPIWWLLRR